MNVSVPLPMKWKEYHWMMDCWVHQRTVGYWACHWMMDCWIRQRYIDYSKHFAGMAPEVPVPIVDRYFDNSLVNHLFLL